MTTLEKVRALFVTGGKVECVDNTYHRSRGNMDYIGRTWNVGKVGRVVWFPTDDSSFLGTFPTRAGDVIAVDDTTATWKIERGAHTVTYRRVG